MQFYVKNTHAEYAKQKEYICQMKADLRPYTSISVREKQCRVNSYFVVTVPKIYEIPWVDDYLTHYLRVMSRNITYENRLKSKVYIDYRK